ncbi:hypothetical protein ACJJIW_20185 [Microbulbifer sp. JMSA004]|uniref:hypothetical protein n=1 Tax=Microbulbifer sp. JMSA004 TaxID=3243370 RepID=UPI0040394686
MLELLNNKITQGLLASIAFAIIAWCIKRIIFLHDEKKIYNLIKSSNQRFRSTEAISSNLNLESARVQHVAGKSKKIIRNEKEKESWRLRDE